MAVGQEPFDVTAYTNRLRATPITDKSYTILHISHLEERMNAFITTKNRLAELQNIIRTKYTYVVEYDIFKEELEFLSARWGLFVTYPQTAINVTMKSYVEELVEKVRVIRNLVYHHTGLDTPAGLAAKHEVSFVCDY
jgi:hypothetical protein